MLLTTVNCDTSATGEPNLYFKNNLAKGLIEPGKFDGLHADLFNGHAILSLNEPYFFGHEPRDSEEDERLSRFGRRRVEHLVNINGGENPADLRGVEQYTQNIGDSWLCVPTIVDVTLNIFPDNDIYSFRSLSTQFYLMDKITYNQTHVRAVIAVLPRTTGTIFGSLIMDSKTDPKRNYRYVLKSVSRRNVFEIKPLIGRSVDVKSQFTHEISIHNPYSYPLQIEDVWSSESFFTLSPPVTHQSSNKSCAHSSTLWEIPPHNSKNIIRMHFNASNKPVGTYRGFVRVELKNALHNNSTFFIPIDVSTVVQGIHKNEEVLEMGTFISKDKRSRDITLFNANDDPVLVHKIDVIGDRSVACQIKVDFDVSRGVILAPHTSTTVATFTFVPKEEGVNSGFIRIFHNSTSWPIIHLPFNARVWYGTLDYRLNSTAFQIQNKLTTSHPMVFLNSFNTAITFHMATIYDPRFEIHDFKPNTQLSSTDRSEILTIRFNNNHHPNVTNLGYKTHLILDTNITRLFVPLQVYDGRLEHVTFGTNTPSNVIKMGQVSTNQNKTQFVTIYNPNPIPVILSSWKVINHDQSSHQVNISFSKIYSTNDTIHDLSNHQPTSYANSINKKISKNDEPILTMHPLQKIIIKVELFTLTNKPGHVRAATIQFTSPHHVLNVQVDCESLAGQLSLTQSLTFENTFPGRVVKQNIYATSTYDRRVKIVSITCNDMRFQTFNFESYIEPNQNIQIATIGFNSSRMPGGNYMSVESDQSNSKSFKSGSTSVSTHEFNNYRLRRSMYDELHKRRSHVFDTLLSIQVDLNPLGNGSTTNTLHFSIPMNGTMVMPELAIERTLTFKVTPIGNTVQKFVKIENPSDHPISVQLILGNDALARFLNRKSDIVNKLHVTSNPGYTEFHLHKEGRHNAVVAPHKQIELGPITFSPRQRLSEAILYVRNNLTLYDMIQLRGIGGDGAIVFEDQGTELFTLQFDISESNLMHHSQDFVYQKEFTLVNKGNIAVLIHGATIDGINCAAYGVELNQCNTSHMVLLAGQSVRFVISFVPDFTSSIIDLTIRLSTSQGMIHYPLKLTLPHHMLHFYYHYQHGNKKISTLQRSFRLVIAGVLLLLALFMLMRCVKDMKGFLGIMPSHSNPVAPSSTKPSSSSSTSEHVIDHVSDKKNSSSNREQVIVAPKKKVKKSSNSVIQRSSSHNSLLDHVNGSTGNNKEMTTSSTKNAGDQIVVASDKQVADKQSTSSISTPPPSSSPISSTTTTTIVEEEKKKVHEKKKKSEKSIINEKSSPSSLLEQKRRTIKPIITTKQQDVIDVDKKKNQSPLPTSPATLKKKKSDHETHHHHQQPTTPITSTTDHDFKPKQIKKRSTSNAHSEQNHHQPNQQHSIPSTTTTTTTSSSSSNKHPSTLHVSTTSAPASISSLNNHHDDLISNYNNFNQYIKKKKEINQQQQQQDQSSSSTQSTSNHNHHHHAHTHHLDSTRERSSSDPATYQSDQISLGGSSQTNSNADSPHLSQDDEDDQSSVDSSDIATIHNAIGMIGGYTRNHMMQQYDSTFADSPSSPILPNMNTFKTEPMPSLFNQQQQQQQQHDPWLQGPRKRTSEEFNNNLYGYGTAANPASALFGGYGNNPFHSVYQPQNELGYRSYAQDHSSYGNMFNHQFVSSLQPTSNHHTYSLFDAPSTPDKLFSPSFVSAGGVAGGAGGSVYNQSVQPVSPLNTNVGNDMYGTPPKKSSSLMRNVLDKNLLYASNESFFSSSPSRFTLPSTAAGGDLSSYGSIGPKRNLTGEMMDNKLQEYAQEEEVEEANPLWNQ
ncbi:hypothetical protein AKO1_012685 [Acrasis kona]|uniref:Transmembrane protein 131 n=1 Tax=Acrasis kona TaxID=1008807 RepID=A0AAW2YWA9_9EUKA